MSRVALFFAFACFAPNEAFNLRSKDLSFSNLQSDSKGNDIPDPTCKKGVMSPDMKVCCTDECGSCGRHKLCNDVGKYHEVTGKLADNCCKERILNKHESCDKHHPPCVLSPSYKESIEKYVEKRPKRQAGDDCTKAQAITTLSHSCGIEKGEYFATLYIEGRTNYQEAKDIANNVGALCSKETTESEELIKDYKAKIAGATDADKAEDALSGTSQVEKWQESLDNEKAEVDFYGMIIKNADLVAADAEKGLKETKDLKGEAQKLKCMDSAVKLKLTGLVDEATKVHADAQSLWKQWLDSAKDYNCTAPPAIVNAATICTTGNTKYGRKCNIDCELGYDGKGTKNSLRCNKQGKFGQQLYGEWTGMAACVGRICGNPPKIDKTKTVVQQIRYPHIANYNCYEGYSVNANASGAKSFDIQCGHDGNFVRNASQVCEPISCGVAPGEKHAEEHKEEFTYAQTATYKCLTGYTTDATPGGMHTFTRTCQSTGRFTDGQGCSPVKCGPAPEYDHTMLDTKLDALNQVFGNTLFYHCKPGYTLDQKANGPDHFALECEADGQFGVQGETNAAKFPSCRAISAGPAPKIEHASFNAPGREFLYGDSAIVTADTGYSLTGVPTEGLTFVLSVSPRGFYQSGSQSGVKGATATGGSSFLVSGIEQFLPVVCGAPPAVEEAKTTFEKPNAVFGDVLSYECTKGYSTDASSQDSAASFSLDCESDASLSRIPGHGKCVNIDDCADHTCGPFGDCVDHLMNYTCNCNSGYAQRWDANTSELVCGNIDDCGPEACGVGKCKDLLNDYICECPTGHEQIDEPNDEGKMDHTCKAVSCDTPPGVEKGATSPTEAAGMKFDYLETVLYQCDEGYTTNASAVGPNHFSIECQASKQFTQKKACLPVKCDTAPAVDFGTPKATSATFNQSVRYNCDEGHTVDGTAGGDGGFTITCQATGAFASPQACKPVSCGEPDPITYAARPSGTIYYQQSVTYACFEGYTMDGTHDAATEFTVKCNADGKTDKLKQCLPKVCGEPPVEIHALFASTQDEGEVVYPQNTEVMCRDGYTIGGEATGQKTFIVTCEATGDYGRYDPRACDPVACSAPPAMANAKFLTIETPAEPEMDGDFDEYYGDGDGDGEGGGEFDGGLDLLHHHSKKANGARHHVRKAFRLFKQNATGVLSGATRVVNYDEKAKYECDVGFTLGGEWNAPVKFNVECLPNGELSFPSPEMQCKNVDDCEQHTCGPKGTCIDEIGPSPAYTCNCSFGYEIQTNAAGEKHCGNKDDCQGKDCGVGTCEDLIGDYTCSCPSGYYIGQKDGSKTCIPVQCASETPSLVNGKLLSSHSGAVDFPTTLRYKCDTGYSMDGQASESSRDFQAQCKADGQLFGMKSCQKISCGTPHVLVFTSLVSPASPYNSVEYDDKAKYQCNVGYTIGGQVGNTNSFEVKCKDDGILSDPKVCDPVKCGTAPHIANARPNNAGIVEFTGAMFTYTCDLGHYVDGLWEFGSTIWGECMSDGAFVQMPASEGYNCKPVSIQAMNMEYAELKEIGGQDVVGGAGIMGKPALFNQGVEYRCNPGYTTTGSGSGPTKITARVTSIATFSPALPTGCIKIAYNIRGRVKDARTGSYITGVRVTVVANGLNANTMWGMFSISGVAPGQVTLKYEKSGFITVSETITVTGNVNAGGPADASMSPAMAYNQWRAVLKWGRSPSDLDTYMKWGWSKAYYGRRTVTSSSTQATLEQDVAGGYGPETMYLSSMGNCRGGSYFCDMKYQVNDYSRTGNMQNTPVEVTLYRGSGVAGTWKISECRNSVTNGNNWWHVFTVSARTNQLVWNCKTASLIQTSANTTLNTTSSEKPRLRRSSSKA